MRPRLSVLSCAAVGVEPFEPSVSRRALSGAKPLSILRSMVTVLGAASAHADIFLCPNGDNYEAAKKYIKDKKLKIKLIAVDTIYDAIEKLEGLD